VREQFIILQFLTARKYDVKLVKIFFILFYLFPIFIGVIGIIPTIYFIVKIKTIQYRIFLILKYLIICFLMYLTLREFDLLLINNILLNDKDYRIGAWELCNFLILLSLIISDIFTYYYYSHTTIVIKSNKGKFLAMVAFLAKHPKIYSSTLKLVGFGMLCFIILIELLLDKNSTILSLIKEFIKN
jgi:hypothetical protein